MVKVRPTVLNENSKSADNGQLTHRLVSRFEQYQAYKAKNPRAYLRTAAADLGTSEAFLVEAGCISGEVYRLALPLGELVTAISSVKSIKAITRNDHAVHEAVGKPRIEGIVKKSMNLQVGVSRLRIDLERCTVAYFVNAESRASIQLYDTYGNSAVKFFIKEDGYDIAPLVTGATLLGQTDEAAPVRLAALDQVPAGVAGRFISKSRSTLAAHQARPEGVTPEGVTPEGVTPTEVTPAEITPAEVKPAEVKPAEVKPGSFLRYYDPSVFRKLLTWSAHAGRPTEIFVTNLAAEQSYYGPIHNIKDARGWFNVLDEALHLHVREEVIHESVLELGEHPQLHCLARDGSALIGLGFGQAKAQDLVGIIEVD